nr:developmental pluripotency-associated protein 2-like [Dasypus novemcinctus]
MIALVPVKEEPQEKHQMESSTSTAEVKLKTSRKKDKVHLPQMNEQFKAGSKPSYKEPVLPLLTILPPVKIHGDTLSKGCQQFRYRWPENRGLFEAPATCLSKTPQHPEQKQDIPDTPQEAKLQSCLKKCKAVTKTAKDQKSSKRLGKEEVTNTVEVSSAQEATLISWTRIAARAAQLKTVNSCPIPTSVEAFLLQASGVRRCVAHGRILPADTKVSVRLQFHAGQVWVT